VVANGGTLSSSDVLVGFAETFEAIASANAPKTQLAMQIGSAVAQTATLEVRAANAAASDLMTIDVSSAAETSTLARTRVMQQAAMAMAMVAQANAYGRHVLALLS
jgi:hypothetical protein